MGRPVNKKYFGTPTAGGDQIKVRFHNGTAAVDGYIVKQKASKKFLCSDAPGTTAICSLLQVATADTAVAAGQMTITVQLDDNSVVQVKKIANRVMTATNGNRYPWNFAGQVDGAATVEEAGVGIDDGATPLDPTDDTLDTPTDFGNP